MPYREPAFSPDWMRVAEAAERLQVDRKTVRNRLYSGALPVRVIRMDRILRLNRTDFEAFLANEAKMLAKAV